MSCAVAWLGAHLLFLYRGPLIHLILTYPTGRTRSRLTMATIAVGYAVSIGTAVWQSQPATMVLAGLLVSVSARDHLRARLLQPNTRCGKVMLSI